MIKKRFGVDFNNKDAKHPALTLPVRSVVEKELSIGDVTPKGVQSRTHKSGWTISGKVHSSGIKWVNSFTAQHANYGTIKGNFETIVWCESEEAFDHFWKHHEPCAWDYWEI